MKTNTERAIEFLNDCQDDCGELQEEGNNKGILEVIELLKRGEKFEENHIRLVEELEKRQEKIRKLEGKYAEREAELYLIIKKTRKYKKMWRELYEIASEFNFFPLMDKIKQKYFPKPKPKTICEKYKDRIISDAKRREIMEMKKYKDYYFYIGAIATLLEEKKITKEEHIELSDTIQNNLKED